MGLNTPYNVYTLKLTLFSTNKKHNLASPTSLWFTVSIVPWKYLGISGHILKRSKLAWLVKEINLSSWAPVKMSPVKIYSRTTTTELNLLRISGSAVTACHLPEWPWQAAAPGAWHASHTPHPKKSSFGEIKSWGMTDKLALKMDKTAAHLVSPCSNAPFIDVLGPAAMLRSAVGKLVRCTHKHGANLATEDAEELALNQKTKL